MMKYKYWVKGFQSDLQARYKIKEIELCDEGIKIYFLADFIYFIDKYTLYKMRERNRSFDRKCLYDDIEETYMSQIMNISKKGIEMNIYNKLQDKHFIHIDKVKYGQVFYDKNNVAYMKVRPIYTDNLKYEDKECSAVNLKTGHTEYIDIKANLRLVNCALDVTGFVVN